MRGPKGKIRATGHAGAGLQEMGHGCESSWEMTIGGGAGGQS